MHCNEGVLYVNMIDFRGSRQNSRTMFAGQASQSSFVDLLEQGNAAQDFTQAVTMLRSLSPTAIDQELRALQVSLSC